MLVSTARYPTVHASKYLQQLCKHFAHKAEVSHDDTTGRAALEPGLVELAAEAGALTVRASAADAKGLIQTRFVVDVHLVTFAHREAFTGLDWQAPVNGPTGESPAA
ncbi:DUF2218 domain-containing protein [Szabonella alba]|uniref:DUF2218 domain-containing protein n=1 Tax=Szabonella alba TaxID=2804194 RepID=A0A8K0XZI8_9RHOB|nr:DUF2218 domain-containing protein [Szabonella alba]MBL4916846.1 DUF2218 domain-containing protein [Szabonella alba]